jgi:hypothetical protein
VSVQWQQGLRRFREKTLKAGEAHGGIAAGCEGKANDAQGCVLIGLPGEARAQQSQECAGLLQMLSDGVNSLWLVNP